VVFSADILIECPRHSVWQLFTDPRTWATWWGGELKSVEPGWNEGGRLIWALGYPSKIVECITAVRLTILGSGNVRNTFAFDDAGSGKTKVTYSENYAGASVSVTNPARRQSECRTVVVNLKRYVESQSTVSKQPISEDETKVYSPKSNTPDSGDQQVEPRTLISSRPKKQQPNVIAGLGCVVGFGCGAISLLAAGGMATALSNPFSNIQMKDVVTYAITGIVFLAMGLISLPIYRRSLRK